MAEGGQASPTQAPASKRAAASGARALAVLWANPIPLECGMISSADRSSPRFSLNVRLAIAERASLIA